MTNNIKALNMDMAVPVGAAIIFLFAFKGLVVKADDMFDEEFTVKMVDAVTEAEGEIILGLQGDFFAGFVQSLHGNFLGAY